MSNYKDRPLTEYIPTVLKEVRQYQALTYGEQPEIFSFFAEIETALDNQFVRTSTEYGVERWERILKIFSHATDTLEYRRARILSRFNEQLPYTIRMLRQMLESLCGGGNCKAELVHERYLLIVRVKLEAKKSAGDVRDLLTRVVPANLLVDFSVDYHIHAELARYTHEELAEFTHLHLREGELPVWATHGQLAQKRHSELAAYSHREIRRGQMGTLTSHAALAAKTHMGLANSCHFDIRHSTF